MNYSKKDILTAISLMLFIITFAIVFTMFFKPLYYSEIYRLGIDLTSGMSIDTIKENYDILIQYQSIFYQGSLQLPDFIMSTAGRIHFEEVKRIFEILQIILFISTCSSIVLCYQQIKQKRYLFLRLSASITIIIPTIIGIIAMMDFDTAFVIFHKIAFRNDFWIFDYTTDPVISILPQTFFMHCFIMIVIIIIIGTAICWFYYQYKQKQILSNKDVI